MLTLLLILAPPQAYATCVITPYAPADDTMATATTPAFSWTPADCSGYTYRVVPIGSSGPWPGPWVTESTFTFLQATWEPHVDPETGDSRGGMLWHVEGKPCAVGAACGSHLNSADFALEVDYDDDGWAALHGDCDDAEESVYAGAPETCGDTIDQDCGGEPFLGVHIGTNSGEQFFAAYDVLADVGALDDWFDWLDQLGANYVGIYVAMQYEDAIDTTLTITTPSDVYSEGYEEPGEGIWTWDADVLGALTEAIQAHQNLDGKYLKVYWAIAPESLDDNGTPTNPNDDSERPLDRDLFGWGWGECDAYSRGYSEGSWIWDDPEGAQVAAFWASYTANAVELATLADDHGVEMLSLGVETDGLFRMEYIDEIIDLFDAVEAVYPAPGKITYDMHWSAYDRPQNWGGDYDFDAAMDLWAAVPFHVLGVSAWIPLVEDNEVTPLDPSEYDTAWAAVLSDRLTEVRVRFPYRPLVFTEFGYADYVNAGYSVDEAEFWERTTPELTAAGEQTQSDIFASFYSARNGTYCDVVDGTFLWSGTILESPNHSYNMENEGYRTSVREWTAAPEDTGDSADTGTYHGLTTEAISDGYDGDWQ